MYVAKNRQRRKRNDKFKKNNRFRGGNIGTQFACQCAYKGYKTTVYSTKPEKYGRSIDCVDSDGKTIISGIIENVTNNIALAFQDAELVFLAYPAFMFLDVSRKIEQYIKPGMYLGILPGTGGAEFAFKNCIEKGAVLFGLQRVPSVARLVEYGKTVCTEGKRDRLFLASIPNKNSRDLSEFMANLFDIQCEPLPNYLSVTMTPSNPILHTTRLRTMFADYEEGMTYAKNPLFYGEWDDASSECLLRCDAEHQAMLARFEKMDLSYVKSLREHYESNSVHDLTEKLRSIKSLNGILSPMKKQDAGWIPDFQSRYFCADFPYGLAIIEEIGIIIGACIPTIIDTMDWYRRITGNEERLNLNFYGIRTLNDIYDFYL